LKHQADIWIDKAEEIWLDLLTKNARQVFSATWLPSHDHTHHQRVWNISKKIIREMEESQVHIDYPLVEGVMIATWFHDLGMASDSREKHGATGRGLCEAYLKDLSGPAPARYDEILEAIETHDIKEARTHRGIRSGETPGILPILAVADDLEALGVIGIYRYTEIYLMRGTGMDQLGRKVLQNVHHRLENLASCQVCRRVLGAFEKEIEILTTFFETYHRQLSDPATGKHSDKGPAGVVNRIRILGLEQNIRPEAMADLIRRDHADEYVNQYFKMLQDDWNDARL
jgi:hypothetical protein